MLVPGLSAEFVEAAYFGLKKISLLDALPSGVLTVDRGGYDEIDSSFHVFEGAVQLLGIAIFGSIDERSREERMRKAIRVWR